MNKNNIVEHWESLTKLRRTFLAVGTVITLPVLLILIVVAGLDEVWKLIKSVDV